MSQFTHERIDAPEGNIVDRAAQSADKMLEATRQSAGSAIDSVADKLHEMRDRASPKLDRLTAPVDALVQRTHAAPLQSLLVAAAAGAALMVLVGLVRSR